MKVAIVTQPLVDNYGCILQNFALQRTLRDLGHDPITLDYIPLLKWKKYIRNTLRVLFRGASYRPLFQKRNPLFVGFVDRNIATVRTGRKYRSSVLSRNGVQAIVVGSDQVWRLKYNLDTLPDMFLSFAGDFKGPRVAYAASFGAESWDAKNEDRSYLAALAARFKAVSVREESGIVICREALGVEAVVMPDPVLLLTPEDYLALCGTVPEETDPFLAAYVLDDSPEIEELIERKANELGLSIKRFTSGRNATLTVEEWLASFRDATCVVTDSFHGAVFAGLFGKPCEIIRNSDRGVSRFEILDKEIPPEVLRGTGRIFLKKALTSN